MTYRAGYGTIQAQYDMKMRSSGGIQDGDDAAEKQETKEDEQPDSLRHFGFMHDEAGKERKGFYPDKLRKKFTRGQGGEKPQT
jgi:hypothetical protein